MEHPFRVIMRQFGYVKVRYGSLTKETAQMLTLFALSNLGWRTGACCQPRGWGACKTIPAKTPRFGTNGPFARNLCVCAGISVIRPCCSDLP
jgi:hypothetical protein